MCGICGCGNDHDHHHDDHHLIQIEEDLLAKNNQFAERNRNFFKQKKITAINMMSSPGSGKTTLLSKTIQDLNHQHKLSIIVGDQQTDFDAQAIQAAGGKATQINTGQVCHLDAHRVGHSLEHLNPEHDSIIFIENIGNLVCPALFDLGETHRVVILSVTEGDNKPLKYPDMFRRADIMLITKVDLLPYVDFDIQQCLDYARQINPNIKSLPLSAKTGEGVGEWYQWLA